jgi:hypothetical protein
VLHVFAIKRPSMNAVCSAAPSDGREHMSALCSNKVTTLIAAAHSICLLLPITGGRVSMPNVTLDRSLCILQFMQCLGRAAAQAVLYRSTNT